MITLYQPAPAFGLLNASPFCMKLEAFLRWQNIPYTVKFAQPDQGPYKKVPFVDYNEQRLGDSNAIIDQLIEDLDINYDGGIDFSYGIAFQRVAEDHLYWALVYFRWLDDEVWPAIRDTFFKAVPEPQRSAVADSARENTRARVYNQGTGRLPEDRIRASVNADLKALSAHLSKHTFLCGQQMTHFDLAVWATLCQLIDSEQVIQLTAIAQKYPALKVYIDRVNNEIEAGAANKAVDA